MNRKDQEMETFKENLKRVIIQSNDMEMKESALKLYDNINKKYPSFNVKE